MPATGTITRTIIPDQKIRNKDVKDFKDKFRDFFILIILNILVSFS